MLYSNSLAKHKDPKAIETTKLKVLGVFNLCCKLVILASLLASQKLEQGWTIPPCREIPKYSVENDKYCPLAIVSKIPSRSLFSLIS